MGALDVFFNLGNKATGGDPVRKALFDYVLYWIVFASFAFIALNDFYAFFFKSAGLNSLFWGIILCIFCWFNYFALSAFRSMYENMKKIKGVNELTKKVEEDKLESVDEMLNTFKDNDKISTTSSTNK
jgi:predicted membrane protein